MYDIFIIERYSIVVISKLTELKKKKTCTLFLYSPNDIPIRHFHLHKLLYIVIGTLNSSSLQLS